MSIDNIVRRRMANSGESYATALQAVLATKSVIDRDFDQSWVEEWLAPVPWEHDEASLEWLRTRPVALHDLMIRFPPSCVVRPLVPLLIPAPGSVGVVQSWIEAGKVGVAQKPAWGSMEPDGLVRAECLPDDIEAVGYWRGWTPERMREVLGR